MFAKKKKSMIVLYSLIDLDTFLQCFRVWHGRRCVGNFPRACCTPDFGFKYPSYFHADSTIHASFHQPDTVMRWPPWSPKDPNERKPVKWTESLNAIDWTHYTDPRNVIPVVLLTATVLGSRAFYRSYLRRIPQASSIRPTFWNKRSLFGRVTKVGDGDGFRLFHMPGGRLAGWEWMPWRKVPDRRGGLKNNTVCFLKRLNLLTKGADGEEGLDTTSWYRCS